MRDRCYCVASKDGQSMIRVRAGKRPDARTTEALQELFDAAQKHLQEFIPLEGSFKEESGLSRIIK